MSADSNLSSNTNAVLERLRQTKERQQAQHATPRERPCACDLCISIDEIERLQEQCRSLKIGYDGVFDKAAEFERRLSGETPAVTVAAAYETTPATDKEIIPLACSQCSATVLMPAANGVCDIRKAEGWHFSIVKGWRCPKCAAVKTTPARVAWYEAHEPPHCPTCECQQGDRHHGGTTVEEREAGKTVVPPDECKDGCSADHKHKWEIEPHPDTDDFDVLVVDSDDEALDAIQRAAEMVWNDIEPGEERKIIIRRNAVSEIGDENG